MTIHQKSTELLQAQVALYAVGQSEIMYPGREQMLLSRLGEATLFASAHEPVTYPRPIARKEFRDDALVVLEPVGTPLPLFDKNEYADLLRNPHNRRLSRDLAEMLQNYSQVASEVNDLHIPLNNYEQAGEHPSSLGSGSNKAAFSFRAEVDGVEKDLVAIIDHGSYASKSQAKIAERAVTLALVKGRAGFEQGVAWSNDPPVVVAEKAPGKSLDRLSAAERAAISDKHWADLVSNFEEVVELGVMLDPMPGNIFYDPEKGLTAIDIRRCNPGQETETYHGNMSGIEALRGRPMPTAV